MNYKIRIKLKYVSSLNFTAQAPYFNSNGETDFVTFGNNEIVITAVRSKRFKEDDIFLNVQNSLYNQMFKCLLIHYCYNGARAGITDIVVESSNKNDYKFLCQRHFDSSSQPFPSFDAPIPFKDDSLKLLLQEDDNSFSLRIIISHWLSQGSTTDRQRKLECVWRTFERLCDHMRHAPLGKRSNIAEGLDKMVAELIVHPNHYTASAAVVRSETLDSLRELRWREMIENNHAKTTPGSNKSSVYSNYKKRLIDPYVDERITTLMKEVIVYRRGELQLYGLYLNIKNDLDNRISQHITKDIDVVAILCYYAYYLRNRLFHGQTLIRSSIFNANQSDDMHIDKITKVLSTLTVELVNNYLAL